MGGGAGQRGGVHHGDTCQEYGEGVPGGRKRKQGGSSDYWGCEGLGTGFESADRSEQQTRYLDTDCAPHGEEVKSGGGASEIAQPQVGLSFVMGLKGKLITQDKISRIYKLYSYVSQKFMNANLSTNTKLSL